MTGAPANFQSESVDGDLSGEAAVASSSTPDAAAVPIPAPGMALTQYACGGVATSDPDQMPLIGEFPSCLMHAGMKPEPHACVISKANRNIEETRCAR